MAEVGLVPFAHLAPEVAATVLPPYRTRFSKHQFTQPQLLAVLYQLQPLVIGTTFVDRGKNDISFNKDTIVISRL